MGETAFVNFTRLVRDAIKALMSESGIEIWKGICSDEFIKDIRDL